MKRIHFLTYAEYYINEQGQVFSKARWNKLVELKIQTNKKGYRNIVLRNNMGKPSTYFISRLLYMTFVGDIPKGMQIDHVDGNKTNNNLSNLEVVNNAENQRRKFVHINKREPNSTCEFCNKSYYKYSVKRFCSGYCQKRQWRLNYFSKNKVWE